MIDYHVILGTAAAILIFLGFIPYFIQIIKRAIKPHALTWLIWGILSGVIFLAQTFKGGGAGAWALAVNAILNVTISAIALSRGKPDITDLDKGSFAAALFGMALWVVTANPLYSVVILTVTDAFGFVPTFRKAYKKPAEDSVTIFAIHDAAFILSILALQALNLTTVLYPAYIVASNTVFVLMALARRRMLKKS